MKHHQFTVTVKTNQSRAAARNALLTAWGCRQPDGCEFHLRAIKTDAKTASAIADALERDSLAMIEVAKAFGEKPQRDYARNLKLVAKYRAA